MRLGVVFPQTEIGSDPSVIRDYAQAAESARAEKITRGAGRCEEMIARGADGADAAVLRGDHRAHLRGIHRDRLFGEHMLAVLEGLER